MGTKMSLAFLASIVIAATIQSAAAQTTHTVSSSSPAGQPSAAPAPAPAPTAAAPGPAPHFAPSPVLIPEEPAPPPAGSSYTVGDTRGWNLTEDTAELYERWASTKNFTPGDILIFNFNNGIHDVLEVTKAGFESCNNSDPINMSKSSPTRIILKTAGYHYFICGIPGHCTIGLKLAINVGGPTSPVSSTAPPDDISAAPLAVAGLSTTFLSFIIASLF